MITSHTQNSPATSFARNFQKPLSPLCCFRKSNFSFLLLLEFVKDKICIFKARLDGESCLCDVIVHKGYRVFFLILC